jgi:predicted ABC-type ATPase
MNDREKPVLLVFAGPNGSGKSTLINMYYDGNVKVPELYINADDMAKQMAAKQNYSMKDLSKEQYYEINKEAADRADSLRQEAIKNKISFCTETVMSTTNKIDLMREAKANGYEVHLAYITTQSSTINVDRVEGRYQAGGHNVPPEKTVSRYERCMELLPQALQAADRADIYNNSFENPKIILEKTIDNEIKLYPQNPPNLKSKWTIEKLEELKCNVEKVDQRFKGIEAGADISKLGKTPPAEKLYNAYAKDTLLKDGNAWRSDKTEKKIIMNMLKDGKSPQEVKAAMKHSPNMASFSEIEKTKRSCQVVNNLIKEPDIKKLIKSRGLER